MDQSPQRIPPCWKKTYWVGAAALYVGVAAGVGLGLRAARESAVRDFSTTSAQRDWEAWREHVSAEAESKEAAVVQRKVPRSHQPPTLVLLRDHFATCLVGSLMMVSTLYGTIAWFVQGMLWPRQYLGRDGSICSDQASIPPAMF